MQMRSRVTTFLYQNAQVDISATANCAGVTASGMGRREDDSDDDSVDGDSDVVRDRPWRNKLVERRTDGMEGCHSLLCCCGHDYFAFFSIHNFCLVHC